MSKTLFFLFSIVIAMSSSCNGQTSKIYKGALETYKYWAGERPGKNMKVLNGQYWCSSHFTKEYILYMEIIVPVKSAKNFPADNKLTQADKKVMLPDDAPSWFKPPKQFKLWLGNQGSMYFIDISTGHIFMYEVQL